MRPLTDCLPEFRIHCPNAPEPVALNMLRQAASDFCHQTRCWREVSEVSFINEALRLTPAYQSLVAIEWAHVTGQPWNTLTPIIFTDTVGEGYNSSTIPRYITQQNTQEVIPHPFRDRTSGSAPFNVTISYWIKPNRVPSYGIDADTQNQLPDHVIEEHCDVIAQGALARAFMVRDESLFDPERAAVAMSLYKNGVAGASDLYIRGNQRAKPRVTGHFM
ncbi:hypothetical protein [uncultured Roseobacter sp.]|uniref:hypothetical protein n=1 Tax=uncultured Roseobacter sp. TaxID=114847 RepID=UPI002637AD8E|nr:hypothetical protein [uncultured Roseobacter sp.]